MNVEHLSISELLEHIQQGHEDSLIVLHSRYASMVYAVVYRILGEQMVAEEVTQDTFMQIWEKGHTYDPARGKFLTWLLTIARRRAIDEIRRYKRRIPGSYATFSLDEHQYLYEQLPDHDMQADLRQSLLAELKQLSEEQQQCIALAYFYGLSHSDIAEYLTLPLGTVKTRIRLGMQKLRMAWLAEEIEDQHLLE